jgi:hypothetical protein
VEEAAKNGCETGDARRHSDLPERGPAMKTSAAHADPALATAEDFPDLRDSLIGQIVL